MATIIILKIPVKNHHRLKKVMKMGHLEIELVGQKLQGKYALIRTKMGEGKKEGKNWLFIKMKSHE